MDKLRLKWRIFSFLFGFCALLLAILWLFQTVLLTDMYKFIRKREINQAVALVKKNIDSPDIQMVLYVLEVNKEIIVMPAREFIPPPMAEYNRSGLQMRYETRYETITQTEDFILQNGNTISLTFHAMITPVEATLSTLRTQLYFITGMMILLAVIIAFAISRHISKPIEDINRSAKVLASGNYNTHFNGRGFLEIKELSDTLNTAAAELSKVESLRRELMANVSHDLRTPLALIYSYAEMMHDFPNEITPQQPQIIMDEAKRMTSLVNDILDISHLETKEIELRNAGYCLTDSIAATINRTLELIKSDSYTINFEYDTHVYINADEVKITQAFYNLLINAVNYSEKNKQIIVRQIVSDNHVKIEVIDKGEGIAPEDLIYVWDRYYRADKKHKRPVAGTGLGLSIVKNIIEMHGGEYGVTSEVGNGSTFWFVLAFENSAG